MPESVKLAQARDAHAQAVSDVIAAKFTPSLRHTVPQLEAREREAFAKATALFQLDTLTAER